MKPTCLCGACKLCRRRIARRAWRAANPELAHAASARNYAKIKADPERYSASLKARAALARQERAEDPDAARERERAKRAANRERYREYGRKHYAKAGAVPYSERNEENRGAKLRARWTVENALRAGRLERQPCEVCGVEKVDAHHDDYAKPLEVRWLCRVHHGQVHWKVA